MESKVSCSYVPKMLNFVLRSAHILKAGQLITAQSARNIHPRWGHVIPMPPKVQIPFAEKMALGAFMCCGMISIPVYVFYNLEYYKRGGQVLPPPEPVQAPEPDMVYETEKTLAEQELVARGKA